MQSSFAYTCLPVMRANVGGKGIEECDLSTGVLYYQYKLH